MTESNTENIPVATYLKMFFRHKEVVIVLTIIGLSLGLCAGLLMPKEYRSSTVILVEEGKTDNPLFAKLAVSTTVQQRLENIRESMLGWYSLVKLVKRLHLDDGITNQREYENLILGIRRRIEIKLRGDNVLFLAYDGKDPVTTQAVVQNITDIFIQQNKTIQNHETADAIKFIEQQLRVYKGKIESAQIAQLQDKLNNLLVDSTEKHPFVKELRQRIRRKREELEKENLVYTAADQIKTEDNQALVSSIQAALNKIGASTKDDTTGLYKLMLLDKLGTVMARDAKVNDQIYNVLLERLETAKITQRLQSSREGTRYTIVDPPRVPLAPIKPNRTLVALIGLALGFGTGIGLVFMKEFFDKSFIDVRDAKEYLGVPLLGAISKITTVEDIRLAASKKRWLYVATILACAIIILTTMTIADVIH